MSRTTGLLGVRRAANPEVRSVPLVPTSRPLTQLPQPGQIFLDHVAWMVPDLDEASRVFERLGFPLTPYSVHGDRDPATGALKPVGTANRLAMLPFGYIELLTTVAGVDTPDTRHVRSCLARHTGVHLLAFTVTDPAREAARISGRGIGMRPVVNLRRTVEAEDGSQTEVAFTVVRAEFERFPEARMQLLSHHTPEHMWQRRYLPPESGLEALVGATIVCDDPQEAAARFADFTGRPVDAQAQPLTIRLDRGTLQFVDQRGAAEQFGHTARPSAPAVAAIRITSRDLGRTRDFLLSQGLRPGALDPSHLLIDQSEALGAHLVIVPS